MSEEFDPKDMALRGRVGGLVRASRYGAEELTGKARRAFRDSFLDRVDPQHLLPPDERERRADALRRAHYATLARKSALSRGRKRAA